MTSAIFGIDDRIEKERDEIGEMVGMKMGEQQVRDLVPIHTSFDQVHQGTRAEIQEEVLIRAHEIPGRRTGGVDVGPGTEDS